MHFYLSVIFLFLISGCASKVVKVDTVSAASNTVEEAEIEDVRKYPQYIEPYLKNFTSQASNFSDFNERYYLPWTLTEPSVSKNSAMWAWNIYTRGDSYGSNLRLNNEQWFKDVKINANFENYATINRLAVSMYYSDLRAFPTHRPLFRSFKEAGEGFPFDYLQNSSVNPMEPLFVTHYSKDRAWVHVITATTIGWLRYREVAFITDEQKNLFMNSEHVSIISDKHPLYDESGQFLFRGRIGMILPLKKDSKLNFDVYIFKRDTNADAIVDSIKIPLEIASIQSNEMQTIVTSQVLNDLLKTSYGWGGMFEDRDCSATMHDFFTPFGIWLPRNSSAQAKEGHVVDISGLKDCEKERLILEEGVPFRTLLYRKGHIVLYLGEHDGKAMVLQNMWGIKTEIEDNEGRKIVGKTVITTLNPGKEVNGFVDESSLIRKLSSMSILGY